MKNLFLLIVMFIFISAGLNAQDNPKGYQETTSSGFAPPYTGNSRNNLKTDFVPTSLARGLNNSSLTASSFDKWILNNPGGITSVNALTNVGAFCGGMGPGGYYAVTTTNVLYRIDTATGVGTLVANVTGTVGTEGWTELAYDKTTSTWYGASGAATSSTLYTINVTTGAATVVGTINTGLVITIAFHPVTNVLYGVDIVTDNLLTINKTTGAGTNIGLMGFNGNFGAGSSFDETGVYYFACIDAGAGNARNFYTMNLTSGTATLVGAFTPAAQVSSMGLVQTPAINYALNPFNLLTPTAGARVVTVAGSSTPVVITWDTSASGATYKWIFGNPTVPPRRLTIPSSSNSITTTLGALDAILAANGFTNNGSATDSAVGQWNVYAYKGTGAPGPDSLISANGPRAITLKRQDGGVLSPLNQDFVDPTFPPPFWSLANGGGTTQYWTRDVNGGYQTGVGSAKYDFWSAGTATPLQTLTSNQFPAVASPNNYLRFNYAQAYYLNGAAVAPDSCIIETSIDNGTTWTRLIGMGASQTLTSGVNSLPGMSTIASQTLWTPLIASNWGTKVFAMPVGTNKVRFVAKSGFGNNLYIDRITSGIITGIQSNVITLTPDKFELSQNYPNPFNPVTQINFSIKNQSLVSLKVYDMLGKEVAQLVNEVKTAGIYNVNFDATNLSSGVYFYKIEAGEFSDIKRMMLIK